MMLKYITRAAYLYVIVLVVNFIAEYATVKYTYGADAHIDPEAVAGMPYISIIYTVFAGVSLILIALVRKFEPTFKRLTLLAAPMQFIGLTYSNYIVDANESFFNYIVVNLLIMFFVGSVINSALNRADTQKQG